MLSHTDLPVIQNMVYQPSTVFRVADIPLVTPNEVLMRLRRAKETARNPLLIIVDLRGTELYKEGYVITAMSTNCCKKIMAKRAASFWDGVFANCGGCPAPRTSATMNPPFSVELTNASVLVYDQLGEYLPNELSVDSPTYYFLAHLLSKGNLVYFMLGGFKAFQALRSQDFIDFGLPYSLPYRLPSCESNTSSSPYCSLVAVKSSQRETPYCRPPTPTKSSTSGLHLLKMVKRPVTDYLKPDDKSVDRRADQRESRLSEDVFSASVSQILPYLYLGNARDSQNLELIHRLAITHIVNVTESTPMPFLSSATSPGIVYLHLPAQDTSQQDMQPAFERAVKFISDAHGNQGNVLVHCQAGVSRSAAVVMAYLMSIDPGISVFEALEFVQTRRPVAAPNLSFMGQLQAYRSDQARRLPPPPPTTTTTTMEASTPAPQRPSGSGTGNDLEHLFAEFDQFD